MKNKLYILALYAIDFILLNISFFTLNYIKNNSLNLSPSYMKLLLLFYVIWLCVSFLIKKFRFDNYRSNYEIVIIYLKSIIYVTYVISFVVVVTGISSFSRLHIFGTCALFFVQEIFLLTIYYLKKGEKGGVKGIYLKREWLIKPDVSFFLLVNNFLLINLAFVLMKLIKSGTFYISREDEKILLIIYGIWAVSSFITRKFDKNNFQNFYFAMAACIKSYFFMTFMMAVVFFGFRLFSYSRLQIFCTLLLLLFFESVLYMIYFVSKSGSSINSDLETSEEIQKFYEQKKLPIRKNHLKNNSPYLMKILSEKCLESFTGLYEFISGNIDISRIDDSEIAIMSSADIFNIKILEDHSISLLINLHRMNDIRWVNRYLLEVHNHLFSGGYIVGRIDTIETHKRRFFNKYPKYYAEILYFLYFLIFRAFPKLTITKKVYFALTKGKNRAISRAEILGRLYFCGYEVLAEQEIQGSLFFIARKEKTPSLDISPSYGPLIQLKRVGLNGCTINVYKFRTMYPYSEYLQDYVYKQKKLREGGKIKDDFRITDWGRFMRRYWLDEIPMLFNWIKGELKLFGVRPLSKHYLSLYDVYLQRMRKKVKPGLIPPYYADLPKKLEEISESEKRYIIKYKKHPWRTQFTYFFKAMNNIILKGVKSG